MTSSLLGQWSMHNTTMATSRDVVRFYIQNKNSLKHNPNSPHSAVRLWIIQWPYLSTSTPSVWELSGRVLDSRPRVRASRSHCAVSLSKNINPSTGSTQEDYPFITERLLMGRKDSNQTPSCHKPLDLLWAPVIVP